MPISIAAIFAAVILVLLIVIVLVIIGNKKYVDRSNETVDTLKETLNRYKVESEQFLKEVEELTFLQKNTILNQKADIDNLNSAHKKLQDKARKIESQKKSSEVRLGLVGENFAPFIKSFPYDHKKFRFLANPCDGIYFGDDEVVFMEFKTGGARLSKSQKSIRDLVAKGKVRFETFRVDDKGTHLKVESDMGSLTKSNLSGCIDGEG